MDADTSLLLHVLLGRPARNGAVIVMKPSLQLRLSQHLALTPQLQQSIRLLQLSTLELNQEIDQALADNPLLERDDDPQALAMRVKPDGSIAADVPLPETAARRSMGPMHQRRRSRLTCTTRRWTAAR